LKSKSKKIKGKKGEVRTLAAW